MNDNTSSPIDSESMKPEPSKDLLEEQNKQLEAQLAEKEDQILRAKADLKNIAQRHLRELDQARSFSISQLIQNLLPCLDAFDSALSSFSDPDDPHKKGIEMVQQLFINTLTQSGVRLIAPNRGENFDPKEHEGIQMVPDDELEPNTIIECVQAGYGIKERILRPARVIIATPKN